MKVWHGGVMGGKVGGGGGEEEEWMGHLAAHPSKREPTKGVVGKTLYFRVLLVLEGHFDCIFIVKS